MQVCRSARLQADTQVRSRADVPTCRRAFLPCYEDVQASPLQLHRAFVDSRFAQLAVDVQHQRLVGERITSLAVLISATSRMVRCVPRMTRGMASRKRGSDTRRITQTSSLPSAGSASGANR